MKIVQHMLSVIAFAATVFAACDAACGAQLARRPRVACARGTSDLFLFVFVRSRRLFLRRVADHAL